MSQDRGLQQTSMAAQSGIGRPVDSRIGMTTGSPWLRSLLTLAVAGALAAAGCEAAAPTPPPTQYVPAPPTATPFRPAAGSMCAGLAGDGRYDLEWQAAVCPAADALVAAQHDIGNLQQAADGRQSYDVIRLAAAATQDLSAVKQQLENAPDSAAGLVLVRQLQSTVSAYQNAVDQFRYGVQVGDVAALDKGTKLRASADAELAKVRKAFGAGA